jgi:hypothetical protein
MFVEATTPNDAEAIARNHIERTTGITGWIKFETDQAPQVPAGRVLSTGV